MFYKRVAVNKVDDLRGLGEIAPASVMRIHALLASCNIEKRR